MIDYRIVDPATLNDAQKIDAINDLQARIADMTRGVHGFHGEALALFGFSRTASGLLHHLMINPDRVLTPEQLLAAARTGHIHDSISMKSAQVYVCAIRKPLKPLGIRIRTRQNYGYYMESEDIKRLKSYMTSRLHGEAS